MSKEKYSVLLTDWLSFGGIILGTLVVVYLFNRAWNRFIRLSSEKMNNDVTNYKFIGHSSRAIILMIGISLAILEVPQLKNIASSILAGAGILAVAIGFASQQALGNVISGLFIVIFKPFKVNDNLRLKDNTLRGVVEDITLRHTILRDFENRKIIIPNSVMNQEIIINSDFNNDNICKHIEFQVGYQSDLTLAKKIILEEILNHPYHIINIPKSKIDQGESPIEIRVVKLGDFSITIRAWVWALDSDQSFIMACDLNESVKKRFDAEGIEIPYPHHVIVKK